MLVPGPLRPRSMSGEKYAPRRTAIHNGLQNSTVTEAIQSRRSVRQFTDQVVSLEVRKTSTTTVHSIALVLQVSLLHSPTMNVLAAPPPDRHRAAGTVRESSVGRQRAAMEGVCPRSTQTR